MKKSGIITAFLGIFMMVMPSKMSAQEENGFIKFSVEEAFEYGAQNETFIEVR